MRVKIKQYNGNLKKWFHEKLYRLKKKVGKLRDTFLEKGHEKLTIMFIPHNEKNIFNFHISKFTIFFFAALFFIIIATSSYALIKNAAVNSKKEELMSNSKDIRSHLLKYEMLTNDTSRLLNKLKPFVEDIYELTKGVKDAEEIWDIENINNDNKEFNDPMLPEEITTLKELQKDLLCATKTIHTMKNFIATRSQVINDTPSVRPLQGFLTSYFGWRRSPFGFGRQYHTGIDIAARSGTEIRATAPGTVIQAGWNGGYGYMVKIQHKYGFQTLYAHCRENSIRVKVGDHVKKGQFIARVGMTGTATGEHCHYEIRLYEPKLGNIPRNPLLYTGQYIW